MYYNMCCKQCQHLFLEILVMTGYLQTLKKGIFMRSIIGMAIVILAGAAFLYLGIFRSPGRRTFSSKEDMMKWLDSRHTHGHLKGQLKIRGIDVCIFIDPPDATPQTGKLSVTRSVDDGKWELVLSADRPERPLFFDTRNDTINIYDKKTMQKIVIIPPAFFTAF